MDLRRSRELLPEVIWRESSPSTNAELRELVAREALPHGSLLVTADQTAGRGRLDRGWVTPPGTSIAASLLVRGFGARGLGTSWLPLLAGSAIATALQPLFRAGASAGADRPGADADQPRDGADGIGRSHGAGAVDTPARSAKRVGVKWPNDVHVRDEEDAIAGRPGKKLCGILCEMLPAPPGDGPAIVVGAGINLLIPEWELPTERATSLLAAGADVGGAENLADPAGSDLADRVLAAYAAELLRLVALAADDPRAVRIRVARHSLTLGTEVRVHLPGGEIVDGRARELAEDGALVVDLPTGGTLTVSAGDVEHLR
ncbi:biotin--[acetyl-CoA-carboxylase] ligase [Leucobacter allii]|uniref:biotin--[acetyl-CoA-carboxylase] ligase n=1 Tax=Leucobacter allii TaxID=2932247 RepID=UPI001FD555E8|nr:biotin--[acetyl-CoA-carboxylase] ligase [Leucobacter allii]UOR01024.1 biotin--[acetyl-CoA-carboxylase] ligase [Leucobacter allii]